MPPQTSPTGDDSRGHIWQVSELNDHIKQLLEDRLPFIWVSGEISNFRIPASGHCYFTLKDSRSQIAAVMFRGQAGGLRFKPQDGLSVLGLGRISVYAPRGAYQIIFEYLEPKGIGSLQIAFEQLKGKLADEGLFDPRHKKPLPPLPRQISIVTSPTGAAVRDFINVAQRRFSNLPLQVVPVSVQGERAPAEIVQALATVNQRDASDVIVLARGGGSIEDLCAFNDETLARAIFASRIPVVSAVGHETDYTIADFVADLRAPTPSAAAEIVVPSKVELKKTLENINQKLYKNISSNLKLLHKQLGGIQARIVHPRRRLQDMRLRLDDFAMRLGNWPREYLKRQRERSDLRRQMLVHLSPVKALNAARETVALLRHRLVERMVQKIDDRRLSTDRSATVLRALNPYAILQRGYSITRTRPEGAIVHDAATVAIGQSLDILLSRGRLTVTVNDNQP